MAQSLSNVMVHLVFSTNNREPSIDSESQEALHAYMTGILRNLSSPVIAIGSMPDHVHVLCVLPRSITIADLVKTLKIESSKWFKNRGNRRFYWQSGYGSFSVGASGKVKAVAYIVNQKRHHKKKSFQDEFRELLRRYDVPFDERYVWD